MTENGKKFLEKASQDEALKSELQAAQGAALHALLKDKGLEDAAEKAANAAMIKVAAAHGVTLTAEDLKAEKLTGLSEDELKAVAGGSKCYCVFAGGGTGEGRAVCACPVVGAGVDKNGKIRCACVSGGGGLD